MKKRTIAYILYLAIGLVLMGLSCAEVIDAFWGGMGSGLVFVAVFRGVEALRMKKDDAFREKKETAVNDERNQFLRNKAWAWAGYLFILIAAVAVIVLKLMGQELLSMAASCAVCLMLVLYWICYWVLNRKY